MLHLIEDGNNIIFLFNGGSHSQAFGLDTDGTHKLTRGLPHRVDPLDDFLLYWEDWEEREREREIIFHFMCLVGKIKK